jgi:hypothetical protein
MSAAGGTADDAPGAGAGGGPEAEGVRCEGALAERIDALAALFERRILDDRDKRRLLDEARDGPYRQYLHPMVHRLALLVDRLDREAGGVAAPGDPEAVDQGRDGAGPSAAGETAGAGDADPSEEVADLARSVRDELLDALAAHGVREIRTTGPFDPARQEAVSVDRDSGADPGTVTAVVRRGFAHGDWVFRPARVTVAAPARRR